jgi:hypothetical protein
MFGKDAIINWWKQRSAGARLNIAAGVAVAVLTVKGATLKASTDTAEKSSRAKTLLEKLDQRLNERRRQWDAEESELRQVMGSAGGGGLRSLVHLRSASDMAGISARFDSAMTNDDNRAHWAMADGLAADAAANPGVRHILRNRSRYENANNCYAMGVGETIANDFAGTGPRLHIDDERLSDAERADFEAKFAAWAAAIDLPGKLRVMRKARRVDGEAVARKITNPKLKHEIKLDLLLIEADQLRFVDINLLTVPSVDGIQFDEYNNPVAYHILRVHPGGFAMTGGNIALPWAYDVFDAKYVIHWFRKDRPGQHRGLPETLPALPLYATLRRYTQATLDAAETAADFAVLLETQAGAQFVDADGNTIDSSEMMESFSAMSLQRRVMAALPGGYTAKQMQPEHPTQTYAGFKREICAEIGRCESVPANVILADSSNSSFASGQLDHKIYFRTREIERDEANRLILDNLLADWIAEGVRIREGNGDRGKPYLPATLRDVGMSIAHTWYWDSNELGDPLKLAAAKSTALRNGLTTIPAEYEAKNKSWINAFSAASRAFGITVEEYQQRVLDSIFAPQPQLAENSDADETGSVDGDKPAPSVKRPAQAALQKAGA